MQPLRLALCSSLSLVVFATACPAQAQAQPAAPVAVDPRPEWREPNWAPGQREAYERARAGWLAECRRRIAYTYEGRRDDGVSGGLIGALFGGLLGNRIAGRHDRTFGTVAGAAVGAVAGAAIDKAEDRNRNPDSVEPDYCQSYLDYYSYAGSQPQAYTLGQPMLVIPVIPVVPASQPAP